MSAPAAGRPLTVHGVPSSPHGSLQNLSLLVVVVACNSARGRAGSFWSGFVLGDFKTFANFASFSSDVTEVVELAGSQSTDDDCWVGRRVILRFVTYCYLSDTIESILCLA